MLNGLHYFEKPFDLRGKGGGSERKAPFHWHKADKKGIAKGFIQLCLAVMPLLEAEQRCLRLDAPTVVLGERFLFVASDDRMPDECCVKMPT